MAQSVVAEVQGCAAFEMHEDGKSSPLPVLLGHDISKETPVKVPLPSYGDEDDLSSTWPMMKFGKDRKSRKAVVEQKMDDWSYETSDKMGLNAAAGVVFAPNFMGVPMPSHVLSAPPGLDPPPGAASHGSVLHGVGACKPCAWFMKKGGCQNGKDCMHCHQCSETEVKARKKNKIAMLRMLEQQAKTRVGVAGNRANAF